MNRKTIYPYPQGGCNVYTPKPIDTSNVSLPLGLAEIVEKLAENSHDIWAQGRITEGWTYGPTRDDVKKQHPDLIPYADLPESEKEYDRKASVETIKAIMALGYTVRFEG